MNLTCKACGNNKGFYRDISIMAKLLVDAKGNDTTTIYDIDKAQMDSYFEIIYCGECGEVVLVD